MSALPIVHKHNRYSTREHADGKIKLKKRGGGVRGKLKKGKRRE